MKEKIMGILNTIKEIVLANKALCKKIIAILIVIIAVIVIASCFKGTKIGNTAGNSHNIGIAAQEGKWIYYVELDDEEPVGISRIKTNGKKVESVAEGYMWYLNVIDNYIYCLEYNEEKDENNSIKMKTNLIKMKTNGKKKEILATDIDEDAITAVDNWIYYIKNGNLYRVNLDGEKRAKVSNKDIDYYQIDGNWIYYIYDDNIAKMKLNGEDSQKIAKIKEEYKENYEALYVKGSKVYYVISKLTDSYDWEYYLYEMNKKGEKVEKICKIDTNVQTINMQEDKIYYTINEDYSDYAIKSIKYNGTDKQVIKKVESAEFINIVEDWIVYYDDDEEVMRMISMDGKKEKDL